MNPASINTVGVVGGGQMGNGIAHVAAASAAEGALSGPRVSSTS